MLVKKIKRYNRNSKLIELIKKIKLIFFDLFMYLLTKKPAFTRSRFLIFRFLFYLSSVINTLHFE